jgi:hypothetical protein
VEMSSSLNGVGLKHSYLKDQLFFWHGSGIM